MGLVGFEGDLTPTKVESNGTAGSVRDQSDLLEVNARRVLKNAAMGIGQSPTTNILPDNPACQEQGTIELIGGGR